MLEFLRRIFSPEPRSSETAKERLRLVLLSDHLSLAPDVVEALKRDLLAVISRYLEIDPTQADVTFEQREREVAMLASIPITGVRDRSAALAANAPPPLVPQEPVAEPEPEPEPEPAPQALAAQPEDEATMEPGEAPPLQTPVAAEPPPAGEEPSVPGGQKVEALQAQSLEAARPPAASGTAGRRRRRKKAAAALSNRPAQAHGTPGFGPA